MFMKEAMANGHDRSYRDNSYLDDAMDRDATYVIKPIEYVPRESADDLRSILDENPKRLRKIRKAFRGSLDVMAKATDDDWKAAIAKARAVNAQLNDMPGPDSTP
jgi:hypothetical protein